MSESENDKAQSHDKHQPAKLTTENRSGGDEAPTAYKKRISREMQ